MLRFGMPVERVYVVREELRVENLYEVTAASQAEAIAKVQDGDEVLESAMSDAFPTGRWSAKRGVITIT